MKRYIFLLILFFFLFLPKISLATSLSVSPVSGTFSVGSTFNVSVLLDTEGKSINALTVFLTFPPDKLQVVSPSVGRSIIDVWTVPPKFNNAKGTIEFAGGIPKGIIASNGVLTNITFRVKSVGDAIIKFLDKSAVFLNDGLATSDLSKVGNGVYQFRLPPPAGPIVVSNTHPDQDTWYPNPDASLQFGSDSPGVGGYSYILSNEPIALPDNISEGTKQSVTYTNLSEGIHYFHIRSLRDGVWGGTTHFAIKVDTVPPAEFPIEILPEARTTNPKPFIQFQTTDASSGLDHYDIRFEPLSLEAVETYYKDVSFFIETESPFVPAALALGSYDVIVRAYDKANNYQEITERLVITTPIFSIISEKGIQIKNWVTIPWLWVAIIGLLLLLALLYTAYRVWQWHNGIHKNQETKQLPEHVRNQLEELKKYKEKYGIKVAILFLVFLSAWSLLFLHPVSAASSAEAATLELAPPLINIFSKNISNKEIFYVGGKTDTINETVVLYLQNLLSGETFSENIESDKNGDWFYRHDTFLSPGEYLLWAQSKEGEEFSPPSPQVTMVVRQTAIQFGSNRLSYETIYLFATILLLLALIGLSIFIFFHFYHGRKKYIKFQREIKEAEESVRRGFAVLRRDIESELALVRKGTMSEELSLEEKHKEAELLNDLNFVQKRIGKEIWEIQKESW